MTKTYYVLQGDYGYGHGWEDLTAADTKAEIKARRREYEENEGGVYRVVTRRDEAEE